MLSFAFSFTSASILQNLSFGNVDFLDKSGPGRNDTTGLRERIGLIKPNGQVLSFEET